VKPRQRKPQRLELFGMGRRRHPHHGELASSRLRDDDDRGGIRSHDGAVICGLYFVVVAVGVQLFSIIYALLRW
jgi:hypothetical protein